MKKGQMEMMGFLVVIIMLVFIGLIFVIIVSQPKEDINKELREGIEVKNLLNSLMKYKHCEISSGKDFSKVVRDCYLNSEGNYCGVDCDAYIKDTIRNVCNIYGCTRYFFEAGDQSGVFLSDGGCPGSKKVSEYNIVAGSEYLVFRFGICSK